MAPSEDQDTAAVPLTTKQIPAENPARAGAPQATTETAPESAEAASPTGDTPAGNDQSDDELGQQLPRQSGPANPQSPIVSKDS